MTDGSTEGRADDGSSRLDDTLVREVDARLDEVRAAVGALGAQLRDELGGRDDAGTRRELRALAEELPLVVGEAVGTVAEDLEDRDQRLAEDLHGRLEAIGARLAVVAEGVDATPTALAGRFDALDEQVRRSGDALAERLLGAFGETVVGPQAEQAGALAGVTTELRSALDALLGGDVERLRVASEEQADATAQLRAQLAPSMAELGDLLDRLPAHLDEAVGGAAADLDRRLEQLATALTGGLEAVDARQAALREDVDQTIARLLGAATTAETTRAEVLPQLQRLEASADLLQSSVGVALGDFREATTERADAHQQRLDDQLSVLGERVDEATRQVVEHLPTRLAEELERVRAALEQRLDDDVTTSTDQLGAALRSLAERIGSEQATLREAVAAATTDLPGAVQGLLADARQVDAERADALRTELAGAQQALVERLDEALASVGSGQDELRLRVETAARGLRDATETSERVVEGQAAAITRVEEAVLRADERLSGAVERLRTDQAGVADELRGPLRDDVAALHEQVEQLLADHGEAVRAQRETADAALVERLGELREALGGSEQRVEAVADAVHAVRETGADHHADLRAQLETATGDLRGSLAELRSELATLRDDDAEAQRLADRDERAAAEALLLDRLTGVHDAVAHVRAGVADDVASAHGERVEADAGVREAIADLREALAGRGADLERRLDEMGAALPDADERAVELRRQLDERDLHAADRLDGVVARVEGALAEREQRDADRVERLRDRMVATLAERDAQLADRLTALQAELVESGERGHGGTQHLGAVLEEVRGDVAGLAERTDGVDRLLGELRDGLAGDGHERRDERESLRGEVLGLREDVLAVREDAASTRDVLDGTRDALDAGRAETAATREAAEAARDRLAALAIDLREQAADRDELLAARLDERHGALEARLAGLADELAELRELTASRAADETLANELRSSLAAVGERLDERVEEALAGQRGVVDRLLVAQERTAERLSADQERQVEQLTARFEAALERRGEDADRAVQAVEAALGAVGAGDEVVGAGIEQLRSSLGELRDDLRSDHRTAIAALVAASDTASARLEAATADVAAAGASLAEQRSRLEDGLAGVVEDATERLQAEGAAQQDALRATLRVTQRLAERVARLEERLRRTLVATGAQVDGLQLLDDRRRTEADGRGDGGALEDGAGEDGAREDGVREGRA